MFERCGWDCTGTDNLPRLLHTSLPIPFDDSSAQRRATLVEWNRSMQDCDSATDRKFHHHGPAHVISEFVTIYNLHRKPVREVYAAGKTAAQNSGGEDNFSLYYEPILLKEHHQRGLLGLQPRCLPGLPQPAFSNCVRCYSAYKTEFCVNIFMRTAPASG